MLFAAALLAAAYHTPAVAAARPDLRVESVSLSRGVAHLDEVVEATVTLRNQGPVGVNHAVVRLRLGERRIGQDFLVDLGPGASVDISTEFFARPEGKQTFVVVIDPDNEIAESSEDNNSAQRTLGILSLPREISRASEAPAETPAPASLPVPDLSVQSLSAAPAPAHPGEPVALRATVHNSGARAVSGVTVRFLADGKPIGADRHIDLAANSATLATATFRPQREGTTAVSVVVDPGQQITESTRSNNTRSVPVVATAPPAASGGGPVAEDQPGTQIADAAVRGANLVCRVETIQGVHYFDGHALRVTIKNDSTAARASPFILGLRQAGGDGWIVRMPVRGVKPGENLVVELPWPDGMAIADGARYEVVADVDNDVPESDDSGDNLAGPFSLVVVGAPPAQAKTPPPPPPRSLRLTAPAPGGTLEAGKTYRIEWSSRGAVGDRVQLALAGRGGRRVVIDTAARNDGSYEWTVPPIEPGRWWLTARSSDGGVQDRRGPFTVAASQVQGVEIAFPTPGASLFVGETYTLAWKVNGPADPAVRLRLRLRDLRTGELQPVLQDADIGADIARYVWTVPEQPLMFGQYLLEVVRADGQVAGRSAAFEINPAFVGRRQTYDEADIDRRIHADLTVSDAGFNEGFFAFTISNKGPDNLPTDVAPGVRLRTYFIRHDPVRSRSDYVICERRLYGWLDVNGTQVVELGRDPECPLGEQSDAQRFVFAVVRIELPPVVGTLIDDPDELNNARWVPFK